MQDLTTETPTGIRVHSRGLGTALAYALLACAVYLLVKGLGNNALGSYGASLAVTLILVVPIVLLADHVINQVVVDDQGLTRIGLFGRKTFLPWSKVTKLRLMRYSAGMRELVVISRWKKIPVSNTIILIDKPNFWEAAFAILDRADAAGWPVKTGFTGRSGWFYCGLEYLPGPQFEDRKPGLKGHQYNRS